MATPLHQSDRQRLLDGWNVLVVDDEPDNLNVISHVLRRSGAVVQTAFNGVQALEYLKIGQPHVIITDLAMPVMDGWMLLETLKKDPNQSHIPVIALTALALPETRARAVEAGFASFFTKPLDTLQFTPTLVNVLNRISDLKRRL